MGGEAEVAEGAAGREHADHDDDDRDDPSFFKAFFLTPGIMQTFPEPESGFKNLKTWLGP
jgi:hypothetical protein